MVRTAYPTLLERKPGSFDFARPLQDWNLPECWPLLRRRLEAHAPRHGTRSFIRVLRLLEKFSLSELTAAVEYALDIDVIDADSIRTIAEHRRDRHRRLVGSHRYAELDEVVRSHPGPGPCPGSRWMADRNWPRSVWKRRTSRPIRRS